MMSRLKLLYAVMLPRNLFLFIFLTAYGALSGQELLRGVLDLTHWGGDDEVVLNGEWRFFKNQLIEPHQIQEVDTFTYVPPKPGGYFSYGTYYAKILIAPGRQNLGIFFPFRYSSCKVWVNRKLLHQSGPIKKGLVYSGFESFVVQFPVDGESINLIIQVSNVSARHYGFYRAPTLGSVRTANLTYRTSVLISSVFAASLTMLAMYCLLQFFIYKRESAYLFLSLICICVLIRSLARNFLDVFPSFEIAARMEYASVYSLPLLFPLYITRLFNENISKYLVYAFGIASAFLVSIVIINDFLVFRKLLNTVHVILGLSFVYGTAVVILTYKRREVSLRFLVVGLMIAIPLITVEMLQNSGIVRTGISFWVELAVLQFLIFQALTLHRKHQKEIGRIRTLNKELDEFIYRTSHDFRTPIASMMGLTNLIQLEEKNPSTREYCRLIDVHLTKMDRLLKDISLLTRINKEDWKPELIEVEPLIQIAQHSKGKSEMPINVELDINLKREWYSSQELVSEMFARIIENAIVFADGTKPFNTLRIRAYEERNNVLINFWDNGVGIPESHLERVTEMFHRASEKSKGSGLGLYIVKQILKRIKGELNIHSKMGEWTEISLTLPLRSLAVQDT